MTDAQGKFALEGLDPELLFQLLVYQKGYVPRYSEGYCDPRLGETALALARHDLDERDPALVLHGRIVDRHGDPIARATVYPQGSRNAKSSRFGALEGVDELALSDENGEFDLGVASPGDAILLSLEARGFAARMSPWLKPGDEQHTLALGRGVTVTGMVVQDGKGVKGLELGIVQQDRDTERFTGERTVGTDDGGRFTFVNVGPNDAWNLYGKMESFRPRGALAVLPVKTLADETTLDVGRLELERGLRLSGRVVLSDEQPLPPDLRVLLGREDAWDSQTIRIAADGSFAFDGLPRELVSLSARVPGYVMSEKNGSLDFLNRFGLLGRMEADTQGLVFLFEPGVERHEFPPAGLEPAEAFERYQALQSSPLRGAPLEAAAPKSP